MTDSQPSSHSMPYQVGDRDARPWGSYEVTAVGSRGNGEEYCEKKITVMPRQALSLQSHDNRRETWRVEEGLLTVILDDKRLELAVGDTLQIGQGQLHAMANFGFIPCIVFERQEGLCREEDIHRYADTYNRPAADLPAGELPQASLKAYQELVAEIKRL